MKKGRALLLAVLAMALTAPLRAADLYVDWECLIRGNLSEDSSVSLSGYVNFGVDTIYDIYADYAMPKAEVGNGTGMAEGSIVIECEITAPDGYQIEDIRIDLLGSLVPGDYALNPQIAWSEKIWDITGGGSVLLVDDAGVDFTQPTERHYVFTPAQAILVIETFDLSGVTYDDGGVEVIDDTAIASLALIQKELSLVPEPGSVAAVLCGLGALALLRRRR
jgi:hypothetical protein